ncbi:hypothetical protein B484DRAFT_246985 [Ochromonadaceae sp. CCMP2298]|nr:hypothetical protein B484DRAFT_246985 [Ochromonadaceae sp. CCMP2298]
MACKSFLLIFLIACLVSALSALRISSVRGCSMSMRSTLRKKLMPAVIGLCIFAGVPDYSYAYMSAEEPVIVNDVAGVRGDGGVGAFSAAMQAGSTIENKKALTNSDYQRAMKGEIPLSSGPRAVKRRALAACKDDSIIQTITPPLTSADCTRRVIKGETEFMEKAIQNLPNDRVMSLVKSYGSPP